MSVNLLSHRRLAISLIAVVAMLFSLPPDAYAVSSTFTVSSNTDDADEDSGGTVYVTDGISYMSGHVGFRFQNVTIPTGATIASATLEFFANGAGTASFSVDLTAQDADSPSTFTTSSNNISSRTRTSAQTLWSTGSVSYSEGQSIVSPNFASTIQEVIDRGGWASGNALVVITTPNSGDKGIHKRSGNVSFAPRLHVTYTTGTNYYVRTDGSNSNSGTGSSTAEAWATIHHAATQALSAGDTVYVRAGTYTETVAPSVDGTSSEPINFIADTTGSVSGWSAGNVVIQAPASSKCLDTNSNDYVQFVGFTFDGDTTVDAIDFDSGLGLRLEKCTVHGGNRGVNIDSGATVTMYNCLVRNNSGDGIVISNGNATIYQCTIADNGDDGIDAGDDSATVINSIIANNADFGFSRQSDGDGTFSHFYNLLYNNSSGNHNGTSPASGEVNSDPLFVGGNDYHLQVGSPAIDAGLNLAGTVDDDLNGVARPQSSAHDMGSYEYVDTSSIYYVRTNGSDSNSGTGTSSSEAWRTVSHAATQSLSPGDIVYVMAGTYAGEIAPSVDGSSVSPIRFVADNDGSIFGTGGDVILQANSGQHVLEILDDDYLSFTGFKMQGHSSGSDTADIDGTGIVLEKCELYDGNGSGIDMDGGSLTLINCLIHSNSSDGITLNVGTMTIWNSTIADNGSDGIEQHGGTATITNSIFAFNSSDGLDLNSGTMTHSYNLIFGSGSSDYEGTSAGTGELSVDPKFASSGSYFLREKSPAIDAGTNASGTADDDLVGTPRPLGSGWDMGCYEGFGLVAHWKFDETSGTTIADASGNGNDASFNTGSPSWVTGIRYNGLQFNGSNDATTDAAFDPPATGSVAFWFKFNSDPAGSQRLFGNNGDWEVRADASGTIICDLATNGAGSFETDPRVANAGEWHHIVALYNDSSNTYRLYLDGVQVASGSRTISDISAATLSFGTRTGSSQRFNGALDDLRVYKYEIDEETVAELYGLVGHWRLDETSGTTADDSSLNSNDGSYQNGTTLAATGPFPGAGDYAADFDGVNDRVVISDSDAYEVVDGVSLCSWVKIDESSSHALIVHSDTASPYALLVGTSNDVILAANYGATTGGVGNFFHLSDTKLTVGKWHHVVATYDGSTVKFYIDGQLDGNTYNESVTIGTTDDSMLLGTTAGAGFDLSGKMFDARIYNRGITAREVAEIYGLVGHWKLDELSGLIAADSSLIGNDGNYWDGAAPGASGPYPGVGAVAAEFDGSLSHVGIYDNGKYDTSGVISVASWVLFDTATADQSQQETIVARNDWGTQTGFALMTDQPYGDTVVFRVFNGSTYYDAGWTDSGIGAGEWHHVVGTFDGTTIRLYVDGTLKASTAAFAAALAPAPSGNLNLGHQQAGRLFDARVYNRAISHGEIANLYGLVGHWKLDEISGTLAADSSGSELHGTYQNSPTLGQSNFGTNLGTSVSFDGTDDYVDLPDMDFDYSNGFSYSGWMKPTVAPASFAPIIAFTNGPSTDFMWFGWQPGYGLEMFLNGTQAGGSRWVADYDEGTVGLWEHCAVSVDPSGNAKLYRNGVESASGFISLPTEGIRLQNFIGFGNSDSADYFTGSLDDVRFYNRPISDNEAAMIFDAAGSQGLRIMKWVEVR